MSAKWGDLCTCSASSIFTGPSASCPVNHAAIAAADDTTEQPDGAHDEGTSDDRA